MRFLLVFAGCIAVFAIVWSSLAVIVNPRGDFTTRFFPRVVLHDRGEKMQLFRRYFAGGAIEGVVLGSSRVMKFNPSELGSARERWFNFGVNSATAEDLLAIARWIKSQGCQPRKLLIGIDTSTLDDSLEEPEDLQQNETLLALIEGHTETRAESLMREARDLKAAFSISYAQDILHAITLRRRPQTPIYEFGPDGGLNYALWDRERALGTYDQASHVRDCLADYHRSLAHLDQVSPRRRRYLETLLREARDAGMTVTLWTTEFQPSSEADLEATAHGSAGSAYRRVVAELGSRYGARVVDFHSLTAASSDSQWYDCVHFDNSLASRMTAVLRGAN
jgi:hypothetical protein